MRALVPAAFVLLCACSPAPGGISSTTSSTPAASASPSPTVTATASVRGAPPTIAGAARDAGVLFIRGADDWIYRYDGAAGTLTRVLRHSVIQRTTEDGAYAAGIEGGLWLLRWDGAVEPVDCGPGRFALVGPSGACLSYGGDADGVWVRVTGGAPRQLLPADWHAGAMTWSPDGRELAVLRSIPGTSVDERGHNELWTIGIDGTRRRLLEARGSTAYLYGAQWSPSGRWLTAWEQGIVSSSVAADGGNLVLIDVGTTRVYDLGPTLTARAWLQWSADGRLAYVKGGGRETWRAKTLVIRSSDATESAVTDDGHVGLAPAWRRGDERDELLWVEAEAGDGNGGVYVAGTGPGARYGVEGAITPRRLPIPRIVEGLRPSRDGQATLVLIRRPTPPPVRDEYGALELWLLKPPGAGTATQTPLISGLGDLAFGYYGLQPSLFDMVAWSEDVR